MRTRVGYCGGNHPDPTYQDIGDHTETTQIDFDPALITYSQLLDIFWDAHNPCGRSFSRQYMSAIFPENDEQVKVAQESKKRAEAKHGKIATEILANKRFYVAEDYHQKYYLRQNEGLMKVFASLCTNDADFRDSTVAARVNGFLGHNGTGEQLKTELARLSLPEDGRKRLIKALGGE